jgi:hypothetical protein
MRPASSRNTRKTRRDRLIFWLTLVPLYFAVTLGLFPLIGVHISAVHAVLSGVFVLAGWGLASWVSRHFMGV